MCLLFRNLQEVFSWQEAWHSPNTLPTMVHGQALRIITQQPLRRPPIQHLWTCRAVQPGECSLVPNEILHC